MIRPPPGGTPVTLLLLLLAPSCGESTPGASPADAAVDGAPAADFARADSAADAPATFEVRVVGGHGGGRYAPGAEVHVFAGLDPAADLLLRWEGDVELLAEPDEWHTSFAMPARPVSLTAVTEPRPTTLQTEAHEGATSVPKTVRYAIPEEPRGVILLHHGTGGSSEFILKDEASYFARVALRRGFAVVASEAEESAARQDLDGNGKLRWNPAAAASNVDHANQDQLVALLRQRAPQLASLPLFAVGMSNGGAYSIALGALAATPAASAFSQLRFAAVVSYCADGASQAAAVTTTPTAWLMCARDTNPQVSNSEAAANHAQVVARGVPALFDEHPPSPLYDARLARVAGVDEATSAAIVGELRAAGWLDGRAMLTRSPDELAAELQSAPADYPTLNALGGGAKLAVRGQLLVSYAGHAFYSDWAARTIAFLEQHL